jgi:hypothetical protein
MGMVPGGGQPSLCAILANPARRPSETGAMNHGSKKIVRHEALRRPLKERWGGTQAFRIIQPGKKEHPRRQRPQVGQPREEQCPQVVDQKAFDHLSPEELVARKEQQPRLFRTQEDHCAPKDRTGAQARYPREAGGDHDGEAGRAPG